MMRKDLRHVFVDKDFHKWLKMESADKELTIADLTRDLAKRFNKKEKKNEY